MKSIRDKEEFIHLRAQGFSFEQISKKINVSKPTLIKWNKEFQKEVSNHYYFEIESILEQYKLVKIHKIETLGSILQKATHELKNRDFTEIPTKELLNIINTLQSNLKSELQGIEYRTDEYSDFSDEIEFSMTKEKTLPLFY